MLGSPAGPVERRLRGNCLPAGEPGSERVPGHSARPLGRPWRYGDGTEYWEIAFSPEDAAEFEESLQTAQGWHALPLDNDVRYLLYGTEGIEKAQDGAYISVNPYLTGKDGGPLFPQVEEGYWFFCDEQTESYTAQGVMERPSQNFTAAVYDSQSRTLYCGELDT